MVQCQEEPVLVVGEAHEPRAQERAVLEIEGTAHVLGGPAERLALALRGRQAAHIVHGQPDDGRLTHDLHELAVLDGERRAPRLVTAQHLGQASLERGHVEGSPAVDRDRLVVDRLVRCRAGVEPQLTLGERGRQTLPRPAPYDLVAGLRTTTLESLEIRRDAVRVLHRSKATGRALRPRSPRLLRQTSGPGSSSRRGSRRSSASNATWPSMRASGAPKQKWAAQPKAR